METIQVVLDAKLLKAADTAAKRHKLNRSQLIRQALQEHLARLRILDLENKAETSLGEEIPVDLAQGYAAFPVAAWSPDGASLVVSMPTENGWGLFRVTPDGKEKVRLTPEGVDCRGASWRAS